jgi:hypothetical protein
MQTVQKIYALKVIKYLAIFNLGGLCVRQFQYNFDVSCIDWICTIIIIFGSRRMIFKELLNLKYEMQHKEDNK